MLLDLDALRADVEALSRGKWIGRIEMLAQPAVELLVPPTRITTSECASRYRYIPDKSGTEASLWDPELTPYIREIQDADDNPNCRIIVIPKPGQVGGTVGAENILFKRMKFGPMVDTGWYMPSDSEVDSYADRVVRPLFDLHPDIRAKVGKSRSDDKRAFKRVSGRILEYLQINRKTITSRSYGLMVVDEADAANPKLRDTIVDQMKVRGATVPGFKGYVCSHMDAGWVSGVAYAWKESSRGIWYWPCPHCGGFSSPCPTAPKGWRMKLDYVRLSGVDDDEMLAHVSATAGLACPHCGAEAKEEHKRAMLLQGRWVHEGQSIDLDGNVSGAPKSEEVLGFWIHGTMSPWVKWADLARRYVAALLLYERTKKPERLREVTAKVLGEVYEGGAAAGGAVDPIALAQRDKGFDAGTVPEGVLFVTAAVDVGHRKFDVMIVGWDLEGRSWVIDRFTIMTRRVAGKDRDIRPAERQEDWDVIREQVLERELPLAHDPSLRMPVAGVAIDTGDGHVTWKAREFARRMSRKGFRWGGWERVRLIKGAKSPAAPELPVVPREVNKDEKGQPVTPSLLEYDLGVHKLKELTLERLAEAEGGPGQVSFAEGLPRSTFEEFAGEVLIDGKWERRGPNESLDLHGYAEAVRQMLRPDRADIKWDVRPPVWARPVPSGFVVDDAENGGVRVLTNPAQKPKKKNILERMVALSETEEQ